MTPAWPDLAALAFLLGVLPALSLAQQRALGDIEVPRMPAYLSSAAALLMLGGVALGVGWRHGGAGALGLTSMPWTAFGGWTAGGVAAGLALTAAFRRLGMVLGVGEEPLLRALLPRTPRERVAFAGLSVAAGTGEELAYRGYVIGALAPWLGVVGAAVLSSVVFGLMHLYQGPLGVARTAALGGLLAWVFLASGSLWPAMAAHALLDVLLGIVLAERMMVPEGASGV